MADDVAGQRGINKARRSEGDAGSLVAGKERRQNGNVRRRVRAGAAAGGDSERNAVWAETQR